MIRLFCNIALFHKSQFASRGLICAYCNSIFRFSQHYQYDRGLHIYLMLISYIFLMLIFNFLFFSCQFLINKSCTILSMRERTVVHESPSGHSDDWKDILIRYHSIQYIINIDQLNQLINQSIICCSHQLSIWTKFHVILAPTTNKTNSPSFSDPANQIKCVFGELI